jgi:hypothetical protein
VIGPRGSRKPRRTPASNERAAALGILLSASAESLIFILKHYTVASVQLDFRYFYFSPVRDSLWMRDQAAFFEFTDSINSELTAEEVKQNATVQHLTIRLGQQWSELYPFTVRDLSMLTDLKTLTFDLGNLDKRYEMDMDHEIKRFIKEWRRKMGNRKWLAETFLSFRGTKYLLPPCESR